MRVNTSNMLKDLEYLSSTRSKRTVFVISHMTLVELRIFLQERLGALIQSGTNSGCAALQIQK